MKLAIRVDDLGWTATETATPPIKETDIGLRLAQAFHAAMGGTPYLGAVIPSTLDGEGLAWLDSNPEGLTVALHGFTHRKSGTVANEFHGMDELRCRNRLGHATKALGRRTTHFVPPFNGINTELVDALWYEGVRYIWGAPSEWETPPQPYGMGKLLFVPSWLPLYGAAQCRMNDQTPALIPNIPRVMQLPGQAVLTLHITWEAAHDDDFAGVRKLVDMIRRNVITPAEFVNDR